MARKSIPVTKKSHGCLIIVILVFLFIIASSALNFAGYNFLDILHYFRPKLSDAQLDKLIYPVAPKGYQYPNPSDEAKTRLINCEDVYNFNEFSRVNPLCLNVFQTTPAEITQKIEAGSYDRIVLYGESSVFDAPPDSNVTKNYIQDLYNNVKFMDQIAIPQLLSAYGLTDVSYVNVTKPYPYLYYRISSLDEANQACQYKDKTEKVSGCAISYYASIIPIFAVGPQMSSALPVLRTTDKQRFSYLTHFPADCYANVVFLHETSHLLNAAGQTDTGERVMDSWLNEQIAGFFAVYGANLACGPETVTLQKEPDVKDVPKSLVEFNSVFPAASLSHSYPKDNQCRQALLTEWYKYLNSGDYQTNYKRFFVEQRATKSSLFSDKDLMQFLLRLDTDPSSRDFLLSKGCFL